MSSSVEKLDIVQGFTFNNPPTANWEVIGGLYRLNNDETMRLYACTRTDLNDRYPKVLRLADYRRDDPLEVLDQVWRSEIGTVTEYRLPHYVQPHDEFLRGEAPITHGWFDDPRSKEKIKRIFYAVLSSSSIEYDDKELELIQSIGADELGTPPLY